MTHDTQDTEGDVPESVGMVVMRCADCELIHIGMIDAEDGMICEMMLDDADVMRMAMQLLFAVFPDINASALVERINAASDARHVRRH